MRIPEPGPLGETDLEARERAITGALFVKRPSGGCVESVVTSLIHLFPDCFFDAVLCPERFFDDVCDRAVMCFTSSRANLQFNAS